MATTGRVAAFDVPAQYDGLIRTASASGTVNVGDWLAYSGNAVFATNAGHSAYWKASAAGIALESNPQYDPHGRIVTASAIRFAVPDNTVIRVSAAFSGTPALGIGAYPVSTGSAVGGVTGLTGVGATWQTGVKLTTSGATGAGGSGVGIVIGWDQTNAVAGTGQLDILLPPVRADYF